MAPAYKLTYFQVSALGEPIRFLFNYGGIEFEDFRLNREDWPQLKPNMPFGQVPVLEHNGKMAHQSVAICRYVAKQVKLTGKNDWEDLEIDSIVDTVSDLRMKIMVYHYEADEKIKESKKGQLFNEVLPYYLERLEGVAKKNNGHLALGRLTWADVYFAAVLKYLNFMTKMDLTQGRPNLKAVESNVTTLPAIKKYLDKCPKTDF